MTVHKPTLYAKWTTPYKTDEGQEVGELLLSRWECECGWKGACWYADPKRARAHLDRHLPAGDRLAMCAVMVTTYKGERTSAVMSI